MKILEELKRLEWEHLDEDCPSLSTLYSLKTHTMQEKKEICKLIESEDIEKLTLLLEEGLYDFEEAQPVVENISNEPVQESVQDKEVETAVDYILETNNPVEVKEEVVTEDSAQHEAAIERAEDIFEKKHEVQDEKFQELKHTLDYDEWIEEQMLEDLRSNTLNESFDLNEEFGDQADDVYKLCERINQFVEEFDSDIYYDMFESIDDGIEHAVKSIIFNGPKQVAENLKSMTESARLSEDLEDQKCWKFNYERDYNNLIEELSSFYFDKSKAIDEDYEEKSLYDQIINDYRQYSGIDESVEITDENLDANAVSKLACLNYRNEDEIKDALLRRGN